MDTSKSDDILKRAILLEKRGKAFYHKVAEHAQKAAVKQIFETMAQEEEQHIQALARQFKAFQATGKFQAETYREHEGSDFASMVLDNAMMAEIAAADFEAAAISAAMAMEKRAVALYADRAASATDPEEAALYNWLSQWETSHLSFLAEIEKLLTEKIWNDNNFWPY